MLCTGLAHVLRNMIQDIIYEDNELIIKDKLSKDSDDRITASRLYTLAKRVSYCCRKRSSFEKGSRRSDTQGKQDVRAERM
jgi:hypothetical protein